MENEASQSQGQVRKCPFCSELIQSDAKKCRFCGEWLDVKKDKIETIPIVENKSASLKSTENNKRGLKIIGIIILVMIAISLWYISIPILIIWYLFYKTDLGKKAFIVIKNKSEAIGHKKILIRISLAVVAIMAISVIIAYPDRKPTIAIMEPQNNAEIQSDRVLIRGTVSPSGKNILLKLGNGEHLEIIDGKFSYEAPLEKESNEIVLSASNKGNESNASITIKRIYTEEEKAELERKKEADRIAMEKQREAEKAEAFIKKQEETAAKIKAEEEKRLQEAEDTRRQEAEAIKKQKEDELALANEKKAFKTSCSSLSYKNLFRNISQYEDQNVYFTGKVIQVMGDGNFLSSMRVEVTRGSYGIWDDVVLLNNLDTEAPKILEEDVIKFWGVVEGERTYSTVLGAEVTVPEINAKIIEIAS